MALSLQPNLSEVQNTLGEFYWARGMPEAASAFQRAVELNPHNADALQNYAIAGSISLGVREFGDPAQLLRRALELDPLTLERHAALGEYLGRHGRHPEVPEVIANIQALFDDVESYRVVDWLYELIGEVDESIAWTLKARNLEPDNTDHIERLADLFAHIGDEESALQLDPSPTPGVLFRMRRYAELIDEAEFRMIDAPDDIEVRYLLALAHHLTGAHESAVHVLSSTGLPDSIFEGTVRSVSEIEAFMTLINALIASGIPEAVEAGMSLAQWNEDGAPWFGDIGWVALYRSCNYAVLGRHEEALELLPRIGESARLTPMPVLLDSWCFQDYADEPVYRDVVHEQEERRAELRGKLPGTLSRHGVEL